MDYNQIISTTLSYADRKDADTASEMDNFILLVEARMNRVFRTQKMTTRAYVPIVPDQRYYGLPPDFSSLRDIQYNLPAGEQINMFYLSPDQMNSASGTKTDKLYYTIINEQIQLNLELQEGELEIVYYQHIPNLTTVNSNNWVSDHNPDCYIFGLLVEINAYAKDQEAMSIWESRFQSSINEVDIDDSEATHSGTPLQIRVG